MPDCDAIRQLVQPYLDDALDPSERARLEAHAAECAACARLLGGYRRLFAALAEPAMPPVPATLAAGVMRRVAAERAGGARWASWVGAAAMLAIACGAALWVWGELPGVGWLDAGSLSVEQANTAHVGLLDLLDVIAGAVEQIPTLQPDLPPLPHVALLVTAMIVTLGATVGFAYKWRGLAEPEHALRTGMAR